MVQGTVLGAVYDDPLCLMQLIHQNKMVEVRTNPSHHPPDVSPQVAPFKLMFMHAIISECASGSVGRTTPAKDCMQSTLCDACIIIRKPPPAHRL